MTVVVLEEIWRCTAKENTHTLITRAQSKKKNHKLHNEHALLIHIGGLGTNRRPQTGSRDGYLSDTKTMTITSVLLCLLSLHFVDNFNSQTMFQTSRLSKNQYFMIFDLEFDF